MHHQVNVRRQDKATGQTLTPSSFSYFIASPPTAGYHNKHNPTAIGRVMSVSPSMHHQARYTKHAHPATYAQAPTYTTGTGTDRGRRL